MVGLILWFVYSQSALSSSGASQIEQDYLLVENEGLFQEYLEMGKKRVLYLCAADHFYKSLHENTCLILMENDQKHVFFSFCMKQSFCTYLVVILSLRTSNFQACLHYIDKVKNYLTISIDSMIDDIYFQFSSLDSSQYLLPPSLSLLCLLSSTTGWK